MKKNLSKRLLFVAVFFVFSIACSLGNIVDSVEQEAPTEEPEEAEELPKVVNHDSPSFAPLMEMPNTGCNDEGYGWIACPEESEPAKLGCVTISPLNDTIGGLTPALPIMACRMEMMYEDLPKEEYLYNIGCPTNMYVRMLTWHEGSFDIIKGVPDMQKFFAPVDSPEEAISYAVAATGYWAEFGVEVHKDYRYLSDEIEDTHAVETGNGYVVNLFGWQLCGCGPHTYYRVDVTVSRDGEVSLSDRIPLYEKPEDDGVCID